MNKFRSLSWCKLSVLLSFGFLHFNAKAAVAPGIDLLSAGEAWVQFWDALPLPKASPSPQGPGRTKCDKDFHKGEDKVEGIVENNTDGDTLRIKIQGKSYAIRFLGIDTPETHYMEKSQGVWGDRAAARMASLAPIGAQVTVQMDDEHCDINGRILGHVWNGKVNLNLQMLSEGLAVNYVIYPNVLNAEQYATVVARSVEQKIGMFADKSLELPYVWRRKVSNRPNDRYVGNIKTKEVFQPNGLDQVPVAYRIFFDQDEQLPSPYHFVK